MLSNLQAALREAARFPGGEQVDAQVRRILRACARSPQSKISLLESAGLANASDILIRLENGLE